MREYRMFFGAESGAFGTARVVWLADDEAAMDIGRRLLDDTPAIDIWQGERRVALLRRTPAADTRRPFGASL